MPRVFMVYSAIIYTSVSHEFTRSHFLVCPAELDKHCIECNSRYTYIIIPAPTTEAFVRADAVVRSRKIPPISEEGMNADSGGDCLKWGLRRGSLQSIGFLIKLDCVRPTCIQSSSKCALAFVACSFPCRNASIT